jgi:hypothetical protein
MKGLTNHGNTCYLNAALQCLVHTPGLTNYVLSGWAEKDLLKKRLNACAFAREYIALTKAYWTAADPPVLDTKALWTALCKLHKPFAGQAPQDAHEALTVMLKHLHDALGRTPRISTSHAAPRVDAAAWDAHLAKDGYSILTELFCGQTACTVADDAGKYANTTHEHWVGLSLGLGGCDTLAQALTKAFEPARIDEFTLDDGTVTSVTQTKRLVYAPLVLAVHLKRFESDGTKIERLIEYPAAGLDLGGHGTWDLFAVCMHRDGHYTCACEVRGEWRLMDDAGVSAVPAAAAVSADAYVLMFKKRLE